MASAAKIIIEHLSRAKNAYNKGSTLRPLLSVIEAVKLLATKQVHSMDRARIDTMMRENLRNLNSLEDVKRFAKGPLAYQKGKEKQLFTQLVPIVKKIKEERDQESLQAMRERKYKIDRCLISGRKFLEHKKISDAQEVFREAVGLYEDEDALFLMIAEAVTGAGFYRESLEYLRRALEINHDDHRACEAAYNAFEGLNDYSGGDDFFSKLMEKYEATPNLMQGRARCRFKLKKYKDCLSDAKAALAANPDMPMAHRLVELIEAKAAKAGNK